MSLFSTIKEHVYGERCSKICCSSERRHIFEFLADIVDNVEYDVKGGNYVGEEDQALVQQLNWSLDELENVVKAIRLELHALRSTEVTHYEPC